LKLPPRKPILIDTDEKYWRSKANKRVRKQRRVKTMLRWSGILLANSLIAGGLAWSGLHATAALIGGEQFAISTFRVESSDRSSADNIYARLRSVYSGENIFSVNLYEIEHLVRMDPWVQAAGVKRVLPNTIRVRVIERRPVAVAIIDGVAHLVDGSGYVIGPSGGYQDDLPVLTGLSSRNSDDLIASLNDGVTMLERLNVQAPLFAQRISELNLRFASHVVVHTLDGGPPLYLDPTQVERNVNRWLDLGEAIRHRAGSLEYVDLRWSHQITVKPLQP
jgi:cell division septal protein FtsQ